jgi:transposase
MYSKQTQKLEIIRLHIDDLANCKANFESIICSLAEQFQTQVKFVMTVPGIQFPSAVSVILEIGMDISVFPSAKHLCSWDGLVPQNNESAGKKKTTRTGAYIKPLLVQCALQSASLTSTLKSNPAILLSKSEGTRRRSLPYSGCC